MALVRSFLEAEMEKFMTASLVIMVVGPLEVELLGVQVIDVGSALWRKMIVLEDQCDPGPWIHLWKRKWSMYSRTHHSW